MKKYFEDETIINKVFNEKWEIDIEVSNKIENFVENNWDDLKDLTIPQIKRKIADAIPEVKDNFQAYSAQMSAQIQETKSYHL